MGHKRHRGILVGCACVVGVLVAVGPWSGSGSAGVPALVSGPATTEPPPTLPGDAVDSVSLEAALRAAGFDGLAVDVYAVRIDEGPAGLQQVAYQAGGGALDADFWPASSVKLLAAVGALEYLADRGFTGAADVTMDGETSSVADLYRAAIVDSSNDAYDRLVQIAGADWLNDDFLTAANGFPATVIQRSYSGSGDNSSPPMTVIEGDHRLLVPAREATGDDSCPDYGNCSNLLELTESVRRVVLDAQLPAAERFPIGKVDIVGLQTALRESDGFVGAAATEVLGDDFLVYSKPGYVPGDACVDVAMVVDLATAHRYLVGIETPEDGPDCPTLVAVAAATLGFLAGR